MNVATFLVQLLLCSLSSSKEYGLFFQNEDSFLQTSHLTLCDDCAIKFEVLINRTSGVVMYAENKLRALRLIVYFERPGVYVNVSEGNVLYNLPLTVDFFSNQWYGWHDLEIRMSEHTMHLVFDGVERRAILRARFLFTEDVVEENEVYFGSGPYWTTVGNVSRFSGFMRNMKYRGCGCDEWRPAQALRMFAISTEDQGECKSMDSCEKDCICYLLHWGARRCECPKNSCPQSSDDVGFRFNREKTLDDRLRNFNTSTWFSSENGPWGFGMEIADKNMLILHVTEGRTCFKNVFLCDNDITYQFWILPRVCGKTKGDVLLLKHSSSLETIHGLTVSRVADSIHASFTTNEGRTVQVRSTLTLSVWSAVSIVYNRTHLSLSLDSYLRDTSNRFILSHQKIPDILSTRFLFIGNYRDYPCVYIDDFLFSTNRDTRHLSSIHELRLEQYSGLRKTNFDCTLHVEATLVDLSNCFNRAFGRSTFTQFYLSLILNVHAEGNFVIFKSTSVKLNLESPGVLVIQLRGISSHTIKLRETRNKLCYIEISLNDTGLLVVHQNTDMVILNVTVDLSRGLYPLQMATIQVNSDSNILASVRLLNVIRDVGARTLRVLTKHISQYSVDFGRRDIDKYGSLNISEGYVDQGLLLKYPNNQISVNWFEGSCVRHTSSCYHGLTVSFWLKIQHDFHEFGDRYFRIFSSGDDGLSVLLEKKKLYFLLIMQSRIVTRFVPTGLRSSFREWSLVEITISQNGVPFLYLDRMETQRVRDNSSPFAYKCDKICIGDPSGLERNVAVLVDEFLVWDVERSFLYANGYISPGPSGHKLISFTSYQLNKDFNITGSANIMSTKYGYALGLINFGPRYANINVSDEHECFWSADRCRRGILLRMTIRPDSLAISSQILLASHFLTVSINMEYLIVEMTSSGLLWLAISKDHLQLFTWQTVEISWHPDDGLRLYINGKLTANAVNGSHQPSMTTLLAPFFSVGTNYMSAGNINYATVLVDDIEYYEANRANLAHEIHQYHDVSCFVLLNFDDKSKLTVQQTMGVVGNGGLFTNISGDVVRIPIPKCFNVRATGCMMCFTVRLWLNVYKADVEVLEEGWLRISVRAGRINLAINNIVARKLTTFSCQFDELHLLNRWNFVEVSWDDDEGVLLFVNREGVLCIQNTSTGLINVPSDTIGISRTFIGAIDELEMYHARLSVLYRGRTVDEARTIAIIEKIREREKIDTEVSLLRKALNSAKVNRTIEVVDSFQFNGSNYVTYKLPKRTYPYIPGGSEELEISFRSYDNTKSSLIWISDSKISKNTLILKNKKLYFTKVYLLPSSNTSKRVTEELEIHGNILRNVLYNVVIFQRAGEIVMKTTSTNDSNIQSMIGRNPLLPENSNVYFGGYNDQKFLNSNQINSSLFGLIYKARLKLSNDYKMVDIIQEIAEAKSNPNIANHGNVVVVKKVVRPNVSRKATFLADLSYVKIPIMINSPFFSLSLPKWNFDLFTSIEIEFSTLESRGLILFIGNLTDFVSLEIFDSQLFFSYKHNGFSNRQRTHHESVLVDENKIQRVYLGRDLSGNIKVYFNRDEVVDSPVQLKESANTVTVIGHLGNHDSWPIEVLSRTSFIGCIHFVRINDADFVNFSQNSPFLKFNTFNFYADNFQINSIKSASGTCTSPSLSSCQNAPCIGGWCKLTGTSDMGQSTNNFRCNCLYSSKSLEQAFTGSSPLANFNIWINDYLLQSRSRTCSQDKNLLVIVDQSFLTVNLQWRFPFVSVLDVEFLILVRSTNSCIMELTFEEGGMTILIVGGRLEINIARNYVQPYPDVNLHDNQWHGLQIRVTPQSIRVKIDSLKKDFKISDIPRLNVSAIKIGNCAGYGGSNFKIKGLLYNSLNILDFTSRNADSLFFSTKYQYPVIKDAETQGHQSSVHRPVTFLNHFHHSVTAKPMNLSWFTQFQLYLASQHAGSLFSITNGPKFLSCIVCRRKEIIFLVGENVLISRIVRVNFDDDTLKFTLSIDLLRQKVTLKRPDDGKVHDLFVGMASWDVGDSVLVNFGIEKYHDKIVNVGEFSRDDQECLQAGRVAMVGCINTAVWSSGSSSIILNRDWRILMKTSPQQAVIIGLCKEVQKCLPETCHAGTCTLINGYSTFCNCTSTEFSGDRCQVKKDRCADVICQNNGRCVTSKAYNGMDVTSCNCSGTGFVGTTCGDVECNNDFCSNNGMCYTVNNARTCNCTFTAFSGQRCETPTCRPSTCNQHGTCHIVPKYSAPICHCSPGYFGDFCGITSSGRCRTPCSNGGVCSEFDPIFKLCSNRYCRQLTTFKCSCDHTFYRGVHCEQVEIGFHPVKDGVLLLENATFTKVNFLKLLFDTSGGGSEKTLVTIWRSSSDIVKLSLIDRTLVIKCRYRDNTMSFIGVIGNVTKNNVLLLTEFDSRMEFYFNGLLGSIELPSDLLHRSGSKGRSKRDLLPKMESAPIVIVGCDEGQQNCFDGLIAGIRWNDRLLIDTRNIFVRDRQRYSAAYFLARPFPSQMPFIMELDKLGRTFVPIILSVCMVILLFVIYVGRRLCWKQKGHRNVYINDSTDLAIRMDLIKPEDAKPYLSAQDASPQLSYNDNYESILTVKSISSSVSSEFESCRILLIDDVRTVNRLNVVDFCMISWDQILVVVNFLPEIRISQSIFPSDKEDILYRCAKISISPRRHYIYCHMVVIQAVDSKEFEIQAWRTGTSLTLLTKPPSVTFTDAVPFADDSYRIVLLDNIAGHVTLMDVELSVSLWTVPLTNPCASLIGPLLLMPEAMKIIVNRELCFEVIDIGGESSCSIHRPPLDASCRQLVLADENSILMLTDNFDLYLWHPVSHEYDHQQMPVRVTIMAVTTGPCGNRVAYGVESGGVLLSTDEDGYDFIELGPQNEKYVRCLKFSLDGGLLAASYDNNLLHVWRLSSGPPLCHFHAVHERAKITRLDFTGDNRNIIVEVLSSKKLPHNGRSILVINTHYHH